MNNYYEKANNELVDAYTFRISEMMNRGISELIGERGPRRGFTPIETRLYCVLLYELLEMQFEPEYSIAADTIFPVGYFGFSVPIKSSNGCFLGVTFKIIDRHIHIFLTDFKTRKNMIFIKIDCQMPLQELSFIPDFAFYVYMNDGEKNIQKNYIVELDGHDFHEKTKEQAKKDKQREREIQKNGYIIIRYTGSEVYNNTRGVLKEIFEYILSDKPQ